MPEGSDVEEKERAWESALRFLPERIRCAVMQTGRGGEGVEEIRLRAGGLCTLTVSGRNVSCGVTADREEIAAAAERLCGGSLYAHADGIREGVITAESGIRAGIAGTASPENGGVRSVRALTSLCLRLPHRRPGAGDPILPFVRRGESVLVWSPRGMGKTTVLREAAAVLAGPDELRRVSVIDTRYELAAGPDGPLTADFYRGWPRAAGMEAAVRTMSPEILICDELSGAEDCAAMERVRTAGVTALCSIHAGGTREAVCHPLVRAGLFSVLCGVLSASRSPAEVGGIPDGWPVEREALCGERRIEVRVRG